MRQELSQSQAQKKTASVTGSMSQSLDVVTVARDKYEALLQELGELKERNKLLLEYKATQEQELSEIRARLHEPQGKLKETQKPFLKKVIDNLKKR